MTDRRENAEQETADELFTDPDKDADRLPRPAPPQTIADEPSGEKGA